MSTPKLVNFLIFLDSRSWETDVNTKTSQFSPFFGFQELRKKHVNTKASQFSTVFGFQELRKKHLNTKTSQFSPFFGFQELRKKHVNTKTGQFSNFWIPGVEKNMYININVHMYITWFCYIWRVVVLGFSPSTPKLVNSAHFLESWSWEKTCQHQKWSIYHIFWIPGVEKNVYIYIYI